MAEGAQGSQAGQGFVHLRVRSAYSLLEGAIKADKIGGYAAADDMPAVGIADRANLFGALEFSVTAKDAGVQPIVGCALPVVGIGEGPTERWAKIPTIVLLAQNEQGWLNLSKLSSAAYLGSREEAEPQVPWSLVAEHAEGLILLSGGPDGPVDALFAAGKAWEAAQALAAMHAAFSDRFYVELQRHGRPEEAHGTPGVRRGMCAACHGCRIVCRSGVPVGLERSECCRSRVAVRADGIDPGRNSNVPDTSTTTSTFHAALNMLKVLPGPTLTKAALGRTSCGVRFRLLTVGRSPPVAHRLR